MGKYFNPGLIKWQIKIIKKRIETMRSNGANCAHDFDRLEKLEMQLKAQENERAFNNGGL